MSKQNKPLESFFKRLYEISLSYEKVNGAYNPYVHKYDQKCLENFSYSDFKLNTEKFLRHKKCKFNIYCEYKD
jgi:hypothetical protein